MPLAALMKEVEVRFAVYYGRKEFVTAARLLEGGSIDPAAYVSAEGSLDSLNAAFARLLETTTERKIVVTPNR